LAWERDLSRLLQGLRPRLYPERYAFAATAEPTLRPNQFALVREDEGLTSIHPDPQGEWARISLEIHSSLDAVCLTGVMASRLADLGISVNIIAALRHDHLFVPWDRREEALECLRSLQGEAENRSA
jgi:hypothetical protein